MVCFSKAEKKWRDRPYWRVGAPSNSQQAASPTNAKICASLPLVVCELDCGAGAITYVWFCVGGWMHSNSSSGHLDSLSSMRSSDSCNREHKTQSRPWTEENVYKL